jgi:alanyl-tRNA synthetase
MTERLYYRDAFLKEFDARIISCEPEGSRWKVILDRAAFYPSSGGQPHDFGMLDGVPVVEVTDAEDHSVVHYTDAAIQPGPVRCQVDWARRFDHMQQHTGQHLLSAVFIELFQFQTISFHLGRETSTIDLQAPSVVPRHIDDAERRVNELIFEDRVVAVRFGTAEELAAVGVRKEVDRQGELRAVEIEGVDLQPCGGTHLASTGQAGVLLIRSIERRRDAWRIEFVCGFRALAVARGDYAGLGAAAAILSCGRREVPGAVEKLIEERRAQHSSAKRLEEALADYQSRTLLAEAKAGLVAAVLPDATPSYLKLLAARVVAGNTEGQDNGIVVLLASTSTGAVVLVQSSGHAKEGKRDVGALLREGLTAFGGKGGGSATFAQGSLPTGDPANLSVAAAGLVERLKLLLGSD